MEWITANLGNIALYGGVGSVVGFLLFGLYSRFTASLSDDEWAAKVGKIVAHVVALTPTKVDDDLLAKVDEIVASVMKK